MTHRLPLYLSAVLAAVCALATTGCNDDNDTYTLEAVESTDYDNCAVTSFALASDASVLRALDSVYFSIDLVNALIYNADSLPQGTVTTHFKLNVGTKASSKVEVTFASPYSGMDTTVNLTTNPYDSINLAAGQARLTVTSLNGEHSRDYTLKLNVHTLKADSLVWYPGDIIPFPATATAQRTAQCGQEYYTLLEDAAGAQSLYSTADPSDARAWQPVATTLPSGAVTATFAATSTALYIADSDGAVYEMTPGNSGAWTATGVTMQCIYGGSGNTLLGASRTDGTDGPAQWEQVAYTPGQDPAVRTAPLPAGCPVDGVGQLWVYCSKWSASPLALMMGGRDAQGNLTGQCWAHDGDRWSCISAQGIVKSPVVPAAGMSLVPYTVPTYPYGWTVVLQPALLAMGGVKDDGSMSATVYISWDNGITWTVADSLLQFPADYTHFAQAQVFGRDYAMSVPARVSKPVTEWECPWLFIFGGVDSSGILTQGVTRGTINRYTFRPNY